MKPLKTYKGDRAIVAGAAEPEAYEAERQALIAEVEAQYGAGGTFRANLSDDFNTLSWTYRVRVEEPDA